MAQAFGRATITINGARINSKPGASIDPGGVTRTSETTDHQTDYSESLRPAMVKCSIPLNTGVSLADLNGFQGTVQFICDSGQTYILANAFRVGELSASPGDGGGVELEFHADQATEVGI